MTSALVLAEYENPNKSTLKTSTSGYLQHVYETEKQGDVFFMCYLLSDPNNILSGKWNLLSDPNNILSGK